MMLSGKVLKCEGFSDVGDQQLSFAGMLCIELEGELPDKSRDLHLSLNRVKSNFACTESRASGPPNRIRATCPF